MKHLITLITLTLSTSTFARQYIQCNADDIDSTDVAVVNLQTETGGTLMISPGMEYDEFNLMNIDFLKTEGGMRYYSLEGHDGYVRLPSAQVGKAADGVKVDLDFEGYKISYTCFSRLYED